MLDGAREADVSRVKLARLTAPTASRFLPPAKAWQDWIRIRLRTWANVISPEFETELAKKVLGQPADLSRHGAADRQLAHEICFNIDDMLPYLLGADLSSGCAILSVLHKELLASTAEHTAALHERFAKPVPCRDKTKLLLSYGTVAHRPQGVAGGWEFAIQRNSDAIPEDGHGWNQRPQQCTRNHRFACAE